jgi:hypothetical protein
VEIDGKVRTAIKLVVELRGGSSQPEEPTPSPAEPATQ